MWLSAELHVGIDVYVLCQMPVRMAMGVESPVG